VLLWRKSVSLALLISVQLAGALTAMAGILNLTTERLRSLFSPEEASSQARIDTFSRGLEILRQYPWGNGLGTSGTIAQRFAAAGGDTPENWYLQIANEMGIAGALLFAAIAVMLIIMCFRRYSQVRDPWLKAICLGMGGAMIGYAGVGIFLHVWEALTTSLMVCFFVGVALAAPDIERTEEHRTGEPIRT
jgi:O-antigen ligase